VVEFVGTNSTTSIDVRLWASMASPRVELVAGSCKFYEELTSRSI